MALVKNPPNTILLGGGLPGGDGGHTVDEEFVCGVQITPGMLVESYDDGGKAKWRPHSSATAVVSPIVAVEKSLFNKGVDDPYLISELVRTYHLRKGSTWWALVASGEDLSEIRYMQSAGNGFIKVATATTADANVAQFQTLEVLGVVTATTRVRTKAL